jgi:hypothetical protein
MINADGKMPELYLDDNTIRTTGMFRRIEPVHFQFLGALEDPKRTQIFYSPTVGWNKYNQLMAGAAFYNIFLPEKKFEYVVMPMYAFGSKDLAGGGNLSYNFYPLNSRIQKIQLSAGAQTYSYQHDKYILADGTYSTSLLKFSKLDSRINFFLLPEDRAEKIKYRFTLRNIFIHKDVPYFYAGRPSSKDISIYEVIFNRNRLNAIDPSDFTIKARGNENLLLASIEHQFTIPYAKAGKGFDVRFYAGNIFHRNTTLQGEDYRLQLSGYSGSTDYLFDEVFLGRTETTGLSSHQFVATEGGFVIPTSYYRLSEKWLAAVNLKTSLPGILPIRLFADFGTFDHANSMATGSKISYEAGIEFNVIKDIFTIYLPLFYSDDIQDIVDKNSLGLGDLVRFELHLNKLNPFTLIKQTGN